MKQKLIFILETGKRIFKLSTYDNNSIIGFAWSPTPYNVFDFIEKPNRSKSSNWQRAKPIDNTPTKETNEQVINETKEIDQDSKIDKPTSIGIKDCDSKLQPSNEDNSTNDNILNEANTLSKIETLDKDATLSAECINKDKPTNDAEFVSEAKSANKATDIVKPVKKIRKNPWANLKFEDDEPSCDDPELKKEEIDFAAECSLLRQKIIEINIEDKEEGSEDYKQKEIEGNLSMFINWFKYYLCNYLFLFWFDTVLIDS